MVLTRRDRTTAAVVLMLIGLWLWVVEDDRPQLVDDRNAKAKFKVLPKRLSDVEKFRLEHDEQKAKRRKRAG